MKYIFIMNPVSGTKLNKELIFSKINDVMRHRGADYEILFTDRHGHAAELAREACEKYDEVTVVACGGDGTLNECASGVVGHMNARFAIYPCGGGNDFLKCVGTIKDFTLDAVIDGKDVIIDTLSVNGVCCLGITSIGLDADVNYNRMKWRNIPGFQGSLGYDAACLETVFKPLGKNLSVTVDGKLFKTGSFLLTTCANSREYGGGYNAAPEAILNDGYMDLILVERMPLVKVLKTLNLYKKGMHIKDGTVIPQLADYVHYFRAKTLEAVGQKSVYLNNDGEASECSAISVSVVPNSLRLVIPPRASGYAIAKK